MMKLHRWQAFGVCGLLLGILLAGCNDVALHKEKRVLMGTFVEVVSPDARAAKIVFDEIARVEGLLSKYKPDSEVSQLNRKGFVKAGPDLYFVLQQAKKFWEVSDGAFDITVGPLIDLWGFTDKKFKLPNDAQIREAMKAVGFEKIIFTKDDTMVKFSFPQTRIDLGAIAKGYAVDCAVKKLKSAGVSSCLINAGGQIYCLGDFFGRKWRVAVQNPAGPGYEDVFELKDQAVSTSGDYRQNFSEGKKTYGHIFDPRTGYPVETNIASVTVIAPDGLTADALSTALFVVGKDKAAKLIKPFPNVRIKVIER